MGFCRRCGEIVNGDRCKCGGTSRESTTKLLFESGSDKWSQRYLSRSSSTSPANVTSPTSSSTSPFGSSSAQPSSSSIAPPARPPPSPSKLAHSFLKQSESEDAELSCVFGSVLSPKDHWQCSACQTKFRQEEVIYPHPDAKTDPAKLGELYYCRQCFAERFRLGNCKRCGLAVLSDAKFIKHEQNLWHEPCYGCTYCSNPSNTSIVIDFAGRPSCESCFDSSAYKNAGILPSPHLSQTEWTKKPTAAPPPPTKWGRPSMSGTVPTAKPSIWSSQAQPSKVLGNGDKGRAGEAPQEKGKAWRIKLERENSPLVESYEELGQKLRQVGLNDKPASSSLTKNPSLGSSMSPTKTTLVSKSPSPVKTSSRPPLSRSPSPTKLASNRWSTISDSAPPSPRPVLQPLQVSSPSPVPSPRQLSPTKPIFNASTTLPTDSPRSISLLKSSNPTLSTSTSTVRDEKTCPACFRPLGYGQFAELPSGAILHLACFVCEACRKPINGKFIDVEEKCFHKECAPALKRYRTIITSLADDTPSSPTSPLSPTHPKPPSPPQLTSELADHEPTCVACSKLLGYGLSVTIPKSGKSYHRDCFTCASCAKGFEKGFVEQGGLAYHEKCAPAINVSKDSLSTLCRDTTPSSPSRTSRPSTLPSLPSYPPKHLPPSSPTTLPPRSLYSTRSRPPSHLGGLIICRACSVRCTEKETVPGPGGTRYHRRCLVCLNCKRELDSECRGGETGILRCEGCRRIEAKSSYRQPLPNASITQTYAHR